MPDEIKFEVKVRYVIINGRIVLYDRWDLPPAIRIGQKLAGDRRGPTADLELKQKGLR